MVSWLKRAFGWLGRNLWAVGAALVAALGAGLVWHYHRGKIRSLEDQAAVEKAHRQVAALDARRQALAERTDQHADEIAAIREERVEVQRAIVKLDHDVTAMTDEQVEAEFRRLF
jgi:uncharacterized protein HemX